MQPRFPLDIFNPNQQICTVSILYLAFASPFAGSLLSGSPYKMHRHLCTLPVPNQKSSIESKSLSTPAKFFFLLIVLPFCLLAMFLLLLRRMYLTMTRMDGGVELGCSFMRSSCFHHEQYAAVKPLHTRLLSGVTDAQALAGPLIVYTSA